MEVVFKNTDTDSNPAPPLEEQETFLQIFEIFKSKIFSYSLHITHSEIIAEDITQEVFMKLWINRGALHEILNMEAWLVTIARNLCFNQLKKQAREQKYNQLAIGNTIEESIDEGIIYKDSLKEIAQIIKHLPKQQMIIFNLKRNEGLKNEEIAQQLNISPNTVKSHFTKALNTIRQALQTQPTLLLLATLVHKYFITH